ncbi:hypothetical protein PMAYCL1PPCAC_22317 [Pristionchus mayeri]|uniref:Uncharacterized protein n=1 Tax=Pristionchus mayeri TaxID=1317129 RepID=A0AAN5I4N9_9BILA|nr:hypothetical protein PMAYCL1PPCAC_22317 [Pristionchus mayeri]
MLPDPSIFMCIHLLAYRVICLVGIIVHAYNFKHRTSSRRTTLTMIACILLLFASIGYGPMMENHVDNGTTMNDGLLYDLVRLGLVSCIIQIALLFIFEFGGYKRGYRCDFESCPDCVMPNRKHPTTWNIDALEYNALCMIIYFPMAYLMAASQVLFDSTDFGHFFCGTSSLVNRTMTIGNSTAPIS